MSPPADEVCMNCSDLDLRGIFGGGFKMDDGFISRKSNTSVRWAWEQTKHCKFCNFIEKCSASRTIVYDPPELDAQLEPRWLKHEGYKWFKFSKEEVVLRLVFDTPPTEEPWLDHLRSTPLPHSLIGCTVSDEYCGVERKTGPIRMIPPRITSFSDVRERIRTCQESHSCMQHAGDRKPPQSVPNLLLIDCASNQVVAAPQRCWYLALSYVWGNQKARAVKIGETLSSLPQTIEDAIKVTSMLGFRYLWVDMYCIKQDNLNHVGDQIRHMDLVYRRAQATIIAAAGGNPDFGLPGVSSARHTRQANGVMNGVSVANFTHNPWELVDSSVWNSRAWTFQESLFSPRRIFFTAEQMIFNCSSGWNCESIEPIQPPTNFDNQSIKWFERHEPPIFNNSRGVIHYLIRQYSHRRLSFSKDVLRAFSGVLHAYENLNSPVRHLWGIPILADENCVLESLYLGLSWEFLKIKAESRPSRRKDFPSWSWTGWEHRVRYRDWYLARKEYLPPPDLEIDIEITSGPTMSWMEVKQAVVKSQHYLSQTLFIRVKAWTTTVRLRSLSNLTWEYATIGPEGHAYTFRAQVPILRDGAELKHMERHEDAYMCTGILLGGFKKSGKNDFHMEHPLLLVVNRGQFWERIGITYLSDSSKVDPLRTFIQNKKLNAIQEWIRDWLPLKRQVIYLG